MSTEIINPSNINIYGINSFINKSIDDNKLDILNLEELQNNFEIDEIDEFEKLPLPAFTQLTYNYKQTIGGEGSYDVNYNRPPIGPIPTFCYCSFCDQVGPEDHAEDCPQPNNTSIFLTLEGVKVYIVQKTTAGPYSELKNSILKKTITQEQLNKVLLLPNSILILLLLSAIVLSPCLRAVIKIELGNNSTLFNCSCVIVFLSIEFFNSE